jgi:hypothetical protein
MNEELWFVSLIEGRQPPFGKKCFLRELLHTDSGVLTFLACIVSVKISELDDELEVFELEKLWN